MHAFTKLGVDDTRIGEPGATENLERSVHVQKRLPHTEQVIDQYNSALFIHNLIRNA